MNITYILLGFILIIQLVILIILLIPFFKNRYQRMSDKKLIEKIIKELENENNISTSLIQRKFHIGYSKASKIMDILEDKGIIGKAGKSSESENPNNNENMN